VIQFGKPARTDTLSMKEAARIIRDGEACAILLDVFSEAEVKELWEDENFPEVTPHKVFKGAGKSGLSIGPIQRLTGVDLTKGLIDYFAYAGKCNEGLKRTKLVQFCRDELGAGYLTVGEWGEFPIASKRSYSADEAGLASVPPHCDCIYFGRDDKWPFPAEFVSDHDQLSMFVSVAEDTTDSALVLWNYRVADRAELDSLMGEYTRSGKIGKLSDIDKARVSARPGQVSILNTRFIHEVEQCKSARQTMGSFMVWKDDEWKIFH
jgi:hypothetical protein